jgi:hypothetical protein
MPPRLPRSGLSGEVAQDALDPPRQLVSPQPRLVPSGCVGRGFPISRPSCPGSDTARRASRPWTGAPTPQARPPRQEGRARVNEARRPRHDHHRDSDPGPTLRHDVAPAVDHDTSAERLDEHRAGPSHGHAEQSRRPAERGDHDRDHAAQRPPEHPGIQRRDAHLDHDNAGRSHQPHRARPARPARASRAAGRGGVGACLRRARASGDPYTRRARAKLRLRPGLGLSSERDGRHDAYHALRTRRAGARTAADVCRRRVGRVRLRRGEQPDVARAAGQAGSHVLVYAGGAAVAVRAAAGG